LQTPIFRILVGENQGAHFRQKRSGRCDPLQAARWEALTLMLPDGRTCIDDKAAEGPIRPMRDAGESSAPHCR
jgi:hypothetical protein